MKAKGVSVGEAGLVGSGASSLPPLPCVSLRGVKIYLREADPLGSLCGHHLLLLGLRANLCGLQQTELVGLLCPWSVGS